MRVSGLKRQRRRDLSSERHALGGPSVAVFALLQGLDADAAARLSLRATSTAMDRRAMRIGSFVRNKQLKLLIKD